MSEYQFYEFLAVDRPLDARQLAEVRSLSTRADITPSSFVNVYHWGNFRGDPRAMMERYYDAHLYLTNWGTREVMLRLPKGVLDADTIGSYCLTDSSTAWISGRNIILAVTRDGDGDDDFFDEDGHGLLGSIVSVRAELATGDLRPLYLAWLHSVAEGELDDDEIEPPVPENLATLSAGQRSLVDFIRLDQDLLDAATKRRRLGTLAREGDHAWTRVVALIDAKKAKEYDEATALLTDLREVSDRDGQRDTFTARLRELRQRYANRPALLGRLDRVGLKTS